jgi:hypothetical protein
MRLPIFNLLNEYTPAREYVKDEFCHLIVRMNIVPMSGFSLHLPQNHPTFPAIPKAADWVK